MKICARKPQQEADELEVALVAARASDLVAYQDTGYAESYVTQISQVWEIETARVPAAGGLTEAIARNLHKLMAYKDEYEVARLCLDPAFAAQNVAEFGAGARVAWRLHPPVLRAMGLNRKISLGGWAKPIMVMLRATRRLRGTRLDPFGLAKVRQVERQLIAEYREVIAELLTGLNPDNHPLAIRIAELPDMVRGYEQIKLNNVAQYREHLNRLRPAFRSGRVPQRALDGST